MNQLVSPLVKSKVIISFLTVFMFLYSSKLTAQWSILENYANYKAFDSNINSLTKDTKGNIYAAGNFKNDSGYYYVAKWDGNIWSELGGKNTSTLKNIIASIVTDNNGNLYAAGQLVNTKGGYYIAKWDGSSWSELGGTNTSNFNSFINFLTIDTSGNLFAGGYFTNNKGKQYVAKWNGSNWQELGGANTSVFNGAINNICIDGSSNVYVTGTFTNLNNFKYIAKWNGNNWVELGGANNPASRNEITAMTIDAKGTLYVGGTFMNAKRSVYVAKWEGNSWSELGGKDSTNFNISNSVTIANLAIDSYGNICAGVGSGAEQYIRLWKGGKWNSLGGVYLYPTTCIIGDDNGNIYTGGLFKNYVGNYFVNKWDGISWGELGVKNVLTLFKSGINCVTTDNSGNVYAAPRSTNDSGKNFVAKWDGTSWSEVGGKNKSTFNGWVNSICFDIKGNLYAGGYFTNDKGKYYVAKWNGNSWTELPWAIDSTWNRRILTLTPDNKGNVFAETDFFVKKWNGIVWNSLDSGLFTYNGSFATDANGNIYVVDNSKTVSKYSTVGRGGFLELGGALKSTFNGTINNLITDAKGNLYAMGNFTNNKGKKYVAQWNGNTWSEVGGKDSSTFNNQIFSVAIDKKANVYVAGFFRNDSSKNYVAKWNGSNWSELGGKNTSGFSNSIYSLTTDASGNVFTGGIYNIKTATDYTSYVAKYGTSIVTPITLNSFTAFPIDNNIIQLNWQTSTETNSSHFIIQHSLDGTSFKNIGSVQARGTGANSYSFKDNSPVKGTNFYRLCIADKDRTSTFSKIVSCQGVAVSKKLVVYPNPSKDNITILCNHIASIQVVDNVGRMIKFVSYKDATNPTLSIRNLPIGVYHIRLQTIDGNVSTAEIVKQ